MTPIETERLRLVPATDAHVEAEIGDLARFFEFLGVEPTSEWPSDDLAEVLPLFLEQLVDDETNVGWVSWYFVDRASSPSRLVGGGGFKGQPDDEGTVEIGYETVPSRRRLGIATEAVGALVTWAFEDDRVRRVIAETRRDNEASIGVLRRLGFREIGEGPEPEMVRFERASAPSANVP